MTNSSANRESTAQLCPQCQLSIPLNPGYLPWCDFCGWNLKPSTAPQSKTIFARLHSGFSEIAAQQLLASLLSEGKLRASWTVPKLLAYSIAVTVHLVTLLSAGVGIYLLLFGFPNTLMLIAGVMLLLATWLMRPSIGKFPETVVPRESYPQIHSLCDRIAAAIGAQPIEGICFDEAFNASIRQVGLPRKALLQLGLPLVTVLESQQLAALIGHEVAHTANGDCTRGLLLGSAINALNDWYQLTFDASRAMRGRGFIAIFPIVLRWILRLAAFVILNITKLLLYLVRHDSQRAEYLADYLASQVAGRQATVEMLENLLLEPYAEYAAQRVVVRQESSFLEELERQVASIPPRERDRLRRVSRLNASRLDDTHPPTAQRIEFLNKRGPTEARITISKSEMFAIRQELAAVRTSIDERVVENYRSKLFGFS